MKIAGLIVLTSVFNAAAAVAAVVVTLQMMSPTTAPGPASPSGAAPADVAAIDPAPTVASATTSAAGDQARVVRPTGPVVEPRTPAPAPAPITRVQPPAAPQPQPVSPTAQSRSEPQPPPLPAPQAQPQPTQDAPASQQASEPVTETVSVDDLPVFRYTEDDLVEEEKLLISLNADETELGKYRSLGVELIGLSEEVATLDKKIGDLTGNRLGQLRRTLMLGERENKLAHAHELQDSQIAISQAVRERNAKALAEARRQAELEREQAAAAARAQAQAEAEAQANADRNAGDDAMTTAQANTEALSSGEDPTGLGAAVSDTARITDAIGGFAAALEQKMAEMEQRQRQQQNPQRQGGSR